MCQKGPKYSVLVIEQCGVVWAVAQVGVASILPLWVRSTSDEHLETYIARSVCRIHKQDKTRKIERERGRGKVEQ